MNIEDIRDYCLSLPGTEEALPFGPNVLVYKVKGKAFLLMPLEADSLRFNVKCDPEKALELRERYSAVQPGFHMNKKHWNTIFIDGSLNTSLVKEWIRDSYALVSSGPIKKKKKN